MKNNVLEWLENSAKEFGNKIAYEDTNNSVTFASVLDQAQRIGSYLSEKISPNNPIAVFSSRTTFTPIIFLGIVYAGCCYAPIDSTAPDYRISNILNLLKPKIILTDRENYQHIDSLNPETEIIIAEDILGTPINHALLQKNRETAKITDPLYIIFTSGSSGIPKGVITSQESLMCYIDAYNEVMDITPDDILGNQSPLDYIAAIRDIYLPLKSGASMFIIPKQHFALPVKLFDILNEKKITAIGWSVSALTMPTTMGIFKKSKPKYLKKVCFSGSVMPCSCLKIWQENLPDTKFVNQYGPTEATASCTYYIIDKQVEEDDVLPIGKPYNNYSILLLNEDNTATANGELGEICVSGPALALGYYNNPELTEKTFIQNPLNKSYRELIYKTGDLGRYNDQGILEFHGRKDRQIKHLGHRVELDEIDQAVKQIIGVDECITLYDTQKESIVLFYTGSATSKEISVEARKMLPQFMIPRKIINLEEMPHLANGKIDMQTIKTFIK